MRSGSQTELLWRCLAISIVSVGDQWLTLKSDETKKHLAKTDAKMFTRARTLLGAPGIATRSKDAIVHPFSLLQAQPAAAAKITINSEPSVVEEPSVQNPFGSFLGRGKSNDIRKKASSPDGEIHYKPTWVPKFSAEKSLP